MNRSLWSEHILRPLVMGAMIGCVVLSLVGLVRLLVPTWNAAYLIAGCVLAAVEANYSYRLIRARSLRGTELLRFRAVELVMLFVLVKAGGLTGDAWADVQAELQTWPSDPWRVLGAETTAAFILVLISWHAATETVRDLERLGEPERSPLSVPPMASLSERFFWGGAVLLIAAGLTRIGIAELLNLRRPSLPGLVLNVLVYFLLGFVMLGQVWLATMRRRWQTQEIRVADELFARWARYSLAFVGLAALVALLLPTGYSVGLLDLVRLGLNWIIAVISFIFEALILLAMLPLAWLLSKLPGELVAVQRFRLPPPQPVPLLPRMPAGMRPTWIEVLQSVVFWAVALGTMYYVVRSYLRDHPELLAALRSARPIQMLRRWWGALMRWLDGWVEVVSQHMPRLTPLRTPRNSPTESPWRWLRLGPLSPRDKVFYYYRSILHRARQHGLPRQNAQTPYEYNAALEPNLPQAKREMGLLTQAFVEALYSRRDVLPDEARQAQANWQRVKAALRTLRGNHELR